MDLSFCEVIFDELVTGIVANIARRKCSNEVHDGVPMANLLFHRPFDIHSRGQGRGGYNYLCGWGRGSKGLGRRIGRYSCNNYTCRYCGIPRYFVKICRIQIAKMGHGDGQMNKCHRDSRGGTHTNGGASTSCICHYVCGTDHDNNQLLNNFKNMKQGHHRSQGNE